MSSSSSSSQRSFSLTSSWPETWEESPTLEDTTVGLYTTSPGPSPHRQHLLALSPEGRRCLEEEESRNLPPDGVYCNTTWDTLYCWPATRAGSSVSESCATVFSDVPHLLNYPDAFAYRECDWSGSWLWGGWTNYSQCLTVIENQVGRSGMVDAVRYITFIGALLSILTLTITFFIFTHFRTLECDRLRVHRNLVVSLLVRFSVMLILTEPFISRRDTTTYRDVDWLCKTLLALRMYAQMASINWMFVEGLFLHSRLTSNVFDSGAPFTLYYTIGWGCPLVFLAAWATTMALHYPVQCWRGYGALACVWILVAPMVAALMINLMFLFNIIRILVTKLRASDAQVRKAIKATAVLFPLLGITNLLFAVNPGDKGDLEGAYMLTNALLQSSQGVFVSVLYCFMNGEVQEVLGKRWQQYRMRRLSQPNSPHRKSTKGTIISDPSLSYGLSPNTVSPLLMSPQTPNSQQMTPLTPSSQTLSPEPPSYHVYSPHSPRPQHFSSQPLSIQTFDPQSLTHHNLSRNQAPGPLVLRLHSSSNNCEGAHSYTKHDLLVSSV